MKTLKLTLFTVGMAILLLLNSSCKKKDSSSTVTDPFNNGSQTRNEIVVISDIHCGANLAYAEMNSDRAPLTAFLEKVRTSTNVKELVLGGDIVDEWFVPATINTYHGVDQAAFVDSVAISNKVIFDKINEIIKDGIIKVTYVPGNHDLAVTPANISRIMPGVNQARDDGKLGLGTYHPDNCPQIAIEHGHRYDIMCSPDPVSNQDTAPGTIMPAGYFSTRLATLHVVQGCTHNIDSFAIVTRNPSGGANQELMYKYWETAIGVLKQLPINNHFNEKIIVTHVNGFTRNYSVDDILPYQTTPGGTILSKLYNDMPAHWAERSAMNNVPVPISADFALKMLTTVDTMAYVQYFNNPASNVRIVVFGHTHLAMLRTYTNHAGQKSIYANSGTWIDPIIPPATTHMNCVVITPQGSDASSQTTVGVYSYMNNAFSELKKESLRW